MCPSGYSKRGDVPRDGQLGTDWLGQDGGVGTDRHVYKYVEVVCCTAHSLHTAPRFGGFGSDHCSGNTEESWRDRAQLVRIAAQKASAAGLRVTAHYHVGDTPQDILAAEEGGANAVGVLTGVFSREELLGVSTQSSTVILDGLHCLDEFLEVVGLRKTL